MERTLASHREYFDVYNVEDFIQLQGWSTLLVDVSAATSIGKLRRRESKACGNGGYRRGYCMKAGASYQYQLILS